MKRLMLLVFGLTTLSAPAYAQSDTALIEQALAAAARRAQEAAAVIKWNADYTHETLKAGTNTWVCYHRSDERRWCMARSYGTGPPSPERGSRHSVTVGHAEPGHRVENPAGESHLHALPYQRATRHGSADDRLVPIDRVLDHGAPAVACSLGPLAAAEFVDRADVPVPLLQRSRRSWTQLGVASRWNAHSDGSPVTLCVSRLVDALGVVRAVCRNRGHALVDLTKQGGSGFGAWLLSYG